MQIQVIGIHVMPSCLCRIGYNMREKHVNFRNFLKNFLFNVLVRSFTSVFYLKVQVPDKKRKKKIKYYSHFVLHHYDIK